MLSRILPASRALLRTSPLFSSQQFFATDPNQRILDDEEQLAGRRKLEVSVNWHFCLIEPLFLCSL